MSKGSIENARVKKAITDSLFTLLSKKKFSEITITDIINEANVARASYYRNFESKEAVIEEFMNKVRDKIIGDKLEESESEIYNKENVLDGFERSLTYCLMNKSYFILLYENGFSSMIQDLFNEYIEDFAGFMPRDSIEIYKLYFVAGAASNILIQWLKRGAIESPREMAKISVSYLEGGIIL